MNFSDKLDREILAIADPIWESIMQGTNDLDFEKYAGNFPETIREQMAEAEFRQMLQDAHASEGQLLAQRKFLACIRHESGVTILWKGAISKRQGECLLELRLDEIEGEIKAVAAWYRS